MPHDNTNRGVLFKNKQKRPDRQDPDYTGTFNIDGTEYWLSAWVNEAGPNSKNPGEKFISLVRGEAKRVQPGGGGSRQSRTRSNDDFDDDIPF